MRCGAVRICIHVTNETTPLKSSRCYTGEHPAAKLDDTQPGVNRVLRQRRPRRVSTARERRGTAVHCVRRATPPLARSQSSADVLRTHHTPRPGAEGHHSYWGGTPWNQAYTGLTVKRVTVLRPLDRSTATTGDRLSFLHVAKGVGRFHRNWRPALRSSRVAGCALRRGLRPVPLHCD